jgi:hypothetical protein
MAKPRAAERRRWSIVSPFKACRLSERKAGAGAAFGRALQVPIHMPQAADPKRCGRDDVIAARVEAGCRTWPSR